MDYFSCMKMLWEYIDKQYNMIVMSPKGNLYPLPAIANPMLFVGRSPEEILRLYYIDNAPLGYIKIKNNTSTWKIFLRPGFKLIWKED